MAEVRPVPRSEAWAQAVAERAVELVSALDVNALLDQVDLNAVLDQVDIDRVLDRIDLDRLLERMDLNELVKHIDVNALVEQTDLGAIIAASSSGIASDVLDVVRSQTVGLNEFIARWIGRLRRRPYTGPPGPPDRLQSRAGRFFARGRCPALRAPGHHPGEPARQVRGFRIAFCRLRRGRGDQRRVYMLALAAISFAARVLTGKDITWNKGDMWVIIAYAVWAFIYFAHSWAASGRPVGMALFGVRVVRDDGTDVSGRRAVVRTLALPLSFLFLGLGFVGILLGNRRRALHDVIAGTAVIYSWDARAARLRFLSKG